MNQREIEAVTAVVARLDEWMVRETSTLVGGPRRDAEGALGRRDDYQRVRMALTALLPEPRETTR